MKRYHLQTYGGCVYEDGVLRFVASKKSEDAKWGVKIRFSDWEEDCYIFAPACLYDGNRFQKVDRGWYPPTYKDEETGENAIPLINNVPALNVDGSGVVEVTTGDMATPCVGIYFRQSKRATFIFFEQAVKGRNIGVRIEKGCVTLQYPSDRKLQYRMMETPHPDHLGECTIKDEGQEKGVAVAKGETVTSRIVFEEFACEDLSAFFEYFYNNRRKVMQGERAKTKYDNALWNTMEYHLNAHNYNEEKGFYAQTNKRWHVGWCGGGMSSYPLLKMGNATSKERALKTLDYLTFCAGKTGFFTDSPIEEWKQPVEASKTMQYSATVRKSGDGLQFLFKHFKLTTPKKQWVEAAKKCADAFVKLFETYGTFGQWVNVQTGELIMPCSSCGAIVPAALAEAWLFFKDEKYLEIAEKSGEYYYQNFVAQGYTTGGPSEILCAPDSESGFAMVESFVTLYEATKDEKWLKYAKDATHLFSSWVVSYEYEWVTDCEFKIQKINTVGSVFANVQNKHSAPGICTSSGDALYRLYKYTGEKSYLELLKDIVYFLPQCVSTAERPLYAYNYPHGDERGKLARGYICERVNMSDWESQNWIGSIWNGSCWCETSVALTFAELMDFEEMQEN